VKLADKLKLAAFYAAIAASIAVGGFLHSGPILADDSGLYLELGAGYDRQKRDEAPQSVIRLRYEFENRRWWASPLVFSMLE
jgi:hypothetical protein